MPPSENPSGIEFLEDDRIDVLIEDVDPLAYKEHQVRGMTMALLDGTGDLPHIRREASDYAELIKGALLDNAYRDDKHDAISDLKRGSVRHSVTSEPPAVAQPVVNVSVKVSDPEGAFMTAVDRLMYDTSLTHDEANALLWELWNPYEDDATAAAYDGNPPFFQSRMAVLEDEDTDAYVLNDPTAQAEAEVTENNRKDHCATIRLLGRMTRNYVRQEDSTMRRSQVFRGDGVHRNGGLLLTDPYGMPSRTRVLFDAGAYARSVSDLKPGDNVRVYPPGEVLLEEGLDPSDVPVLGKIRSEGNNVEGTRVLVIETHSSKTYEVPTAFGYRWFVYGTSAKKIDTLFEFHPGVLLDDKMIDDIVIVYTIDNSGKHANDIYSLKGWNDLISSFQPTASDRVAFVDSTRRSTLLNMRRADDLVRYPITKVLTRADARVLLSVIAQNVSSRVADKTGAGVTLIEETEMEEKKEKKRGKRKMKVSKGGDVDGRPAPLINDDILTATVISAYAHRFDRLTYDSIRESDGPANSALYIHNTVDRGRVLMLLLMRERMARLKSIAASLTVEKGGKRARAKSESTTDRRKKRRVGGGVGETEEAEFYDDALESPECKDRPLLACPRRSIISSAHMGFKFAEEGNEGDLVTSEAECARVLEAGTSPFSAFMYSVVDIGDYGRGLVVDRLYQSTPECIEAARSAARTALLERESLALKGMAGFDHDSALRVLDDAISTAEREALFQRKTPLLAWPQMAADAWWKDHSEEVVDGAQLARRAMPSMVMTFEDRSHYAPLMSKPPTNTTVTSSHDVLLLAAEAKRGDGEVNMKSIPLIVRVADALDSSKTVVDTFDGGVAKVSARLDAISKLRNPPERPATEAQRQARLVRSRREELMRRSPKAAEDYDAFESKLIERVRSQVYTDHARRETLTSAAIVFVLIRDSRSDATQKANTALSQLTSRILQAVNAIIAENENIPGGEHESVGKKGAGFAITEEAFREEVRVIEGMLEKITAATPRIDVNSRRRLDVSAPLDDVNNNKVATRVWPNFRPRPSSLSSTPSSVSSTAQTVSAELVQRINAFVNTQGSRKEGDESSETLRKRGQRHNQKQGAASSTLIKRGSAGACCVSRVDDDMNHFKYYYEFADPQMKAIVEEFKKQREQELVRAGASERPSHLHRRTVENFSTYPNKLEVASLRLSENDADILATKSMPSEKYTSEEDDGNDGSAAALLSKYLASNPGVQGDSTITTLLSALKKPDNEDGVEKAASDVLRRTQELWRSAVTPEQKAKEKENDGNSSIYAESVWHDVIDTSSKDAWIQKESASVLANFIRNGMRVALNETVHLTRNQSHTPSTASSSAVDPYHDVRYAISRLDPPSLIQKVRGVFVNDIIPGYTSVPDLVVTSVWSEDDDNVSSRLPGWIACVVLGHSFAHAASRLVNSMEGGASDIGTLMVSAMVSDLRARHRFSSNDIDFEDAISKQREAEKKKKIDIYGQMTEDELESLRMYKKIANFDEHMLASFLDDRRRGRSILSEAVGTSDEATFLEDDSMTRETPPATVERIDPEQTFHRDGEGIQDEDQDDDNEEEGNFEQYNEE
jgi:hypothetical protein